jgi:membrane protease YdiL (CAAX protease family)
MTLPAYFYLAYYEKVNVVKFLKLDSNITSGMNYIIISIVFLIILSLNTQYQLLSYIKFNPFLSISIWIDAIILAAFMDEIIFRGILLQKLANVMIFRKANALSSLVFVFIHFPKWFSLGYFSHYNVIGSINFIFCFGLLMGYILKKSNSLWPCIFIHLINNFLSYALNL